MAAYLDVLKSSGLGELRQMSKNCLANYLWIPSGTDQNLALPLRCKKEPKEKWVFIGKYDGLYILNFENNDLLVLSSDEITLTRRSTMTLRSKYASRIIKSDKIVDELQKFTDKDLRLIDDILKMAISPEISREDAVARHGHNNELEAQAHAEFKEILSNNMVLTGEGCLGDWAYYKEDLSNVISMQTKSGTISNDNNYRFGGCEKYNGIVLVCRPMPKIKEGTLVIPGDLVNITSVHLTVKPGTKYFPYMIADDKLAEFLSSLFVAVSGSVANMTWPSGISVDISKLVIRDFKDVVIPTSAAARVEFENCQWRNQMFPSLDCHTPLVQNTTVDKVINGVRVQDKSCTPSRSHLRATLTKNGGRKNNKCTSIPYEENDFDCLWIFPNNGRRYLFIIPMSKLIEKQHITTATTKGKQSILCYAKDYKEYEKGGPKADIWTQSYCLDTEDVDIQNQVLNVLKTCTASKS